MIPNNYSTEEFEREYTYTGNDLGAVWSKEKTTFKVWAPTAEEVRVNLYKEGTGDAAEWKRQLKMQREEQGVWAAEKKGNLSGIYYTYEVTVGGVTREACDPYARTTGVNGERAMVLDLRSTNPKGWEQDKSPHAGRGITDAVIYELHIRDVSSDKSSGIRHTGKFLGLAEKGTKTPGGNPTGLDHIKKLGVTHLHLLPFYDYGSVDETRLEEPQFNWGYDPVNYNVPEGSYATDPYHGEVRVRELKEMILAIHRSGISVVMDVVYNHVHDAEQFCFNKIVPGYFSRIDKDGNYSNGSGCGNDTASERSMVKKYIVDSVFYWAQEYHIDGFRFDLAGLLDTETINAIVKEVHGRYPDVIFYGEGWNMYTGLTKEGYLMATQSNSRQTPGFAYFNDTIRDLLKGHVFDTSEKGYVTGQSGREREVEKCFLGLPDWCASPAQTVNYVSCHDNFTLMDRIALAVPDASREERIKMNNLAAAIYMLAQGVPFLQAGEEMLRTKRGGDGKFVENSYASPDEVNSLKWDTLDNPEYAAVYDYYRGLIAFRKTHGAFHLASSEEVHKNVIPLEGLEPNVTGFRVFGGEKGEYAKELFVIFNPGRTETQISLPKGKWNVCINGEKAGTKVIEAVKQDTVSVAPISAMVLVKGSMDSGKARRRKKIQAAGAVTALTAAGAALAKAAYEKKR